MHAKIVERLKEIEHEYDVTVLYACEAGSRAWGMASEDSDYDVRFIYCHNWQWYMQLQKKRDVIEQVGDVLDISGWDLGKALQLFKKSNPPLLEWLHSPIVYVDYGGFADKLRALLHRYYNPTACCYHYFHMAKGNYRDYLKRDGEVWIKKYFYVLRPLLAVRYIQREKRMPPIEFDVLVKGDENLSPHVERDMFQLLADKRAGKEMGMGPRVPSLNEFIRLEMRRLDNHRFEGSPMTKDWYDLNDLFLEVLLDEV